MAVEEHDVIDMMFPDSENIYLVITDSLPWSEDGSDDMNADMEHAHHLTQKVSNYAGYIADGGVWEDVDRDEFGHLQAAILIVSQFPLNATGQATLNALTSLTAEDKIPLKEIHASQLEAMLAG